MREKYDNNGSGYEGNVLVLEGSWLEKFLMTRQHLIAGANR